MQSSFSKSERVFLEDGISQGIRIDGRGYFDFRAYTVETGIFPSANGSARVYTNDSDVVACVKCEATKVDKDRPNEGDIKISVDCNSVQSGDLEVYEMCRNMCIDLSEIFLCRFRGILGDLCRIGGRYVWYIYIDITILKGMDMCLMDIMCICVRSALSDTIIPDVRYNEIDEIDEKIGKKLILLDVNDRESSGIRFPVHTLPICISIGQIKNQFLYDLSSNEILCSDFILNIYINHLGHCIAIHKIGKGTFSPSILPFIIQNCQKIGLKLIHQLDLLLESLYLKKFHGIHHMPFITL